MLNALQVLFLAILYFEFVDFNFYRVFIGRGFPLYPEVLVSKFRVTNSLHGAESFLIS
jgi:hypothetical protein